jgi:hypothetical protein
MSDEFDIEDLFRGLPSEQAREVANAMIDAARQKLTAIKSPQPNAPNFDDQEAAELEALQKSGVRGSSYIVQKRNLSRKYTQLRTEANAPAPEVDPELEQASGDERALKQLYQSRILKIRRGDVRAVSKLKSQFRAKGLNL